MDKQQRMQDLIEIINKHNYNYYTLLTPTISDQDWDKLYYELVDLENELGVVLPDSPTQRVGGEALSGFQKNTHKVRLYSLSKVRDVEDLASWMKDMKEFSPNTKFSLEYKFDGLQLVLEYDNGYLISATTRGDGLVGENVLAQAKTIRSVPLSINFKGHLIVQGEGMMTQTNLKEYNKTAEEALKNARNAVAGAIRNLDPKETAKRKLDFFCYNVLEIENKQFKTQEETHKFLEENGFKTGDYFKLISNIQEATQEIERIDKIKEELDVMIDGLVFKINDCAVRDDIGYTNKFPKWAMAYKFEAQEVSTILKDVVWQVGRTGRVTPIAIVEPVELAGATVTRATLNNIEDIEKKNVSINSRILMRRSNEVIPEVLGLLEKFDNSIEIKEPDFCPCCNAPLTKKGPLLYCTNTNGCTEQIIDKIVHFARRDCMNIEGLSIKTVGLLNKECGVVSPSDLYSLTFENLYNLESFKDKKANNLLDSIEKSKNVSLHKFLNSLGIQEVGIKTARDLEKNFNNLEEIMNASLEELSTLQDIGPIIAQNIYDYFKDEENIAEINKLIEKGVAVQQSAIQINKNGAFSGLKVVLTGTLQNYKRQEAQEIIEKNGGEVVSSVSKNTSLVLAGADAGSKLTKAKTLNIKVITEEEFINLINNS